LQSTENRFHALVLPKSAKPIRIDGNLDEWTGQERFEADTVRLEGWKGAEDLSAHGFATWDADYLYLAVAVTDDKHSQDAEGVAIWSGDGLQMGIAFADEDGSIPREYHELGVATNGAERLSKWRWTAPGGFGTDDSIQLDYAIERKDQHTFYEIAIPWTELTREAERIKPGLKMKFSLLVNDNDGEGRRGWLEYNSGIGVAKDLNLFGDLFLAE